MSTNLEAAAHDRRCERVSASLHRTGTSRPLALAKRTSNLFRDRKRASREWLDLGEFTHVIEVNPQQQWVDVEGGVTYESLVDATLERGTMPAVVPQLRMITTGGAAAGVGIEATSFREGLVHHTMLQLQVLLPDGKVVDCAPDNEHRDLFHGFANSYGTLGYALRLRLRTRPVKPCVRVQRLHYRDGDAYFDGMEQQCAREDSDFVDGAVFRPDELVLNAATFVDDAPWLSDYGFEHVYYRSVADRKIDFLTVRDYLWRWDTDWFWCSKNFGVERPWVRRLLGRSRLNSRTYLRLMRWNARWGVTRGLSTLRGLHTESVIQDVDIPLPKAAEFLSFLLREIGILPVWVCPLHAPDDDKFRLYPLAPGTCYVNFGFWDVVASRTAHERGYFNRKVEREVMRLGGIKSLYSDSFFTREEFAAAYRMQEYEALKERYDPCHRLPNLYDKCVLRA